VDESGKLTSVIGILPNGACPIPGVATAGQPPKAAWSELGRAGYRTVLDLRAPEEPRDHDEPEAVQNAGLDYIAIPVQLQTLGDAEFDAFREVMRDAARRPIVVHCATSNRVGALLLPYFALDEGGGRSLDDATLMARDSGLRSPELLAMALDYARRAGAR
jgi:protein tyrosine phosphatase (PTP) superfamily phosphohydrolase (DUF442 family)